MPFEKNKYTKRGIQISKEVRFNGASLSDDFQPLFSCVSLKNKNNFMLVKKEVLKSMKDMPDHFRLDDAIDRLIILSKIENAQSEIKEGNGLTTEQALKKLGKWQFECTIHPKK